MVILIFTGMTFSLALIDIAIKFYIEAVVKEGEERKLWNGKIKIRRVHNGGMILNLLENKPKVVKGVSVLVTMLLTIYQFFTLMRKGRHVKKVGLSLMAGGAWSNTFDRVVRGYVVDYVGFKTKGGAGRITYNLGDFFIFIGTFIVMLRASFHTKKKAV